MKKTLKKLISLIAVATIVATSSVVALADNEYMSYSNDFSSATGVTVTDNLNWVTANRGDVVMSVANGVLTSTRTHYDNETSGRRSNSTEASIVFDKSFSEGTIQAKFDFTMAGGTNQGFVLTFTGYQPAGTGLAISKTNVKMYYPNSTGISTPVNYNEDDSAWIEEGVGYRATVTLDIASATYTVNIVKIADTSDAKTFTIVIPDDRWGTATKDAITGIALRSRRDHDLSTGTITFDNLSVDAYTETNYEVNSIYRSDNGLETNKKMDGYTFKGLTVSKLTNIPAPANASFITASYDGSGRMINAVANKLSELGSTPVNADVEGNTVKSFVLDMSNANPLAPVYQYADPVRTMRKLDFEFDGDYKVGDPYVKGVTAKWVTDIQAGDGTYGITWNGYENAGVGYEKVLDGENNVLKVERSTFKSGNDYYNYKDGVYTIADSNTAQNNNLTIGFDKESNAIKVTFKFKFEGTKNTSQVQRIAVLLGGVNVFISRNQNGVGNVQRGVYPNSAEVCTWTDMKAGEWYTFTAEMTSSGAFSSSVAGEFDSGYAVKSGTSTIDGVAIKRLEIGSPRDLDVVDKNLTDVKTPTSVWYIDDVVVEY